MLAHIRNGKVIRVYRDGRGRVELSSGGTVSPPVAGYKNGDDKIVPLLEETLDNSTTSNTRSIVTDKVYQDKVVRTTTIEDAPASKSAINVERDRRLQADFLFNGVPFQRDSKSLQRITGAATLAGFAIANGAQPGNLRWANSDRDFCWIASDNSLVPMDAQTVLAFGQAAANVETNLIFAAAQLRAMDPIPADYADDKWWP